MFGVRMLRCARRVKHQSLSRPLSTEQKCQTIVSLDESQNEQKDTSKNKFIIYNSVIENGKHKLGWRQNKIRDDKLRRLSEKMVQKETEMKSNISVVLRYISDDYKRTLLQKTNLPSLTEPELKVNSEIMNDSNPDECIKSTGTSMDSEIPDFLDLSDLEGDEIIDTMQIGTADPTVPMSQVSCGGCGAMLHCQSKTEAGFVPKELFEGVPDKHLRAMICQRCHFLKHYNTALKVNVSPKDYPKILSQIKKERALILLIVDLTDFPCSIWPQLSQVIGSKRPVVVVGNKVDLLPTDKKNYLQRIEQTLKKEVQRVTGITDIDLKHVALVSARTGYGIEELINKLQTYWVSKGDIYLVGCTNVGKSSVFNVLVNSDFCKVKAIDLIQRATISSWPGTTLNLLKFPIMRPDPTRMFMRTSRLQTEREIKHIVEKLRKEKLRVTRKIEDSTVQGHVGRTFRLYFKESMDPFSQKVSPATDFDPGIGLNPKDPDFITSKWCYDTPGVVQPDQILHLLTEEELNFVLPEKIISPNTFRIKPGQSLFLAGLGRVDYLRGEKPIMLTVFASYLLPLTVCSTEHAQEMYSQLLGTELLAIPCGDEQRLARWPGLQPGPELHFSGIDWKESCADIVLSSAGWMAVTLGGNMKCTLQAHTPEARGIHIRQPALLPFAVTRRGPKIRHSPTYRKYIPLLT